jgi:hypothetical protein
VPSALEHHEQGQFLAQHAEQDRHAERHRQPQPPRGHRREREIDPGIGAEMAEQREHDAPATSSGARW